MSSEEFWIIVSKQAVFTLIKLMCFAEAEMTNGKLAWSKSVIVEN